MSGTFQEVEPEPKFNATRGAGPAFFVYVLGTCGKAAFRTYVGWTTHLERRLAAHNSGRGARSTRGQSWALLYAERHATRRDAMSREWHLKRDRRFRKSLSPAMNP